MENKRKTTILHILTELDGGGVDRLMLDYYKNIDRIRFVFDFAVTSDVIGILEEPLREMGAEIYHIHELRKGFFEHRNDVKNILKNKKYDIVHCHSPLFFDDLHTAEKMGVGVRVCHCHIANEPGSVLRKIAVRYARNSALKHSTALCACSIDAAKWGFGTKLYENNQVRIVNNAIEAKMFSFSEEVRERLRKELNIDDKFVVICVGRLCYQKNQTFMIDAFKALLNEKPDSVLLLVGRGEDEELLREKVAKENLTDTVLFLGVRNDVYALLQAADVFALPSRYEGLGIVYVEAQAACLPTFSPDIAGPREVVLTPDMHILPVSATPEEWAKAMVADLAKGTRSDNYELIKKTGYDIQTEASKLAEYYDKLLGNI